MTSRTTSMAIALAGAVVLAATLPSLARNAHTATRIGKRPADQNGYFFFPGNYLDDNYVYDPPRPAEFQAWPTRHRGHHARRRS